jgi:hypothetical protein
MPTLTVVQKAAVGATKEETPAGGEPNIQGVNLDQFPASIAQFPLLVTFNGSRRAATPANTVHLALFRSGRGGTGGDHTILKPPLCGVQ